MAYNRVNWQSGTKVSDGYVEINETQYPVTPPVYSGSTPVNPASLNIMDAGIEENSKLLNGKLTVEDITLDKVEFKNKFNKNTVTENSIIDLDGSVVSGKSGWCASDFIPVKANTKYVYQGITNQGSEKYSAYYDSNKQFISYFRQETGYNNRITIPNGAQYVRFSMQTSDKDGFQLELGEWSTEYTQYKDFNGKSIPQQALEPSNPLENDLWIDTTINALKRYNGTTWEIVGSIAQVVDSLDGESTTAAPSIHAVNSRFAVLTGTISISNSSTGRVNVDYPTGFNENNCVVIANMVNNLGSAKYSTGKVRMSNSNQGNANPSVTLSTNNIIIEVALGEQVTNDYNYKVVLMKI